MVQRSKTPTRVDAHRDVTTNEGTYASKQHEGGHHQGNRRSKTPQRNQSPSRNLSYTAQNSSDYLPYSYLQSHSQQRHAQVPLLFALIEEQEWSDVVQRLEQHPEEAKRTLISLHGSGENSDEVDEDNQRGFTALHLACQHRPPIEVVDGLLQVHENAVQAKGPRESLPLHIACSAGASPEVVARLIMTYPSATRCKDVDGQVPLHLAVQNGAHEDVLMALIVVHPKATVTRNVQGQTPVELASSSSSSSTKRALKRAPLLMAVSKAAMNKLAYESDSKLREVVEVYQDRMTQVKEKYEEDKTHAVSLEVQLRQELWNEKERTGQLEQQVGALEQALRDKARELQQQQLLLEHIQGLISQHSRREERSSAENLFSNNVSKTQPRGAMEDASQQNHTSLRLEPIITSKQVESLAPITASSPSSAAAIAPPTIGTSGRQQPPHGRGAPQLSSPRQSAPSIIPESRQEDSRVFDHTEKEEENRLAKIAVQEWMSGGTRGSARPDEVPHANSNASSTSTRQSVDDDEEERDPPPVPYHPRQIQDQPEDYYFESHPSSSAVLDPSPRSAAVATVKEWFGTTSSEYDPDEDDIDVLDQVLRAKAEKSALLYVSKNRKHSKQNQAQQQQQQQQQQPVVYSNSLLDRSKRSSSVGTATSGLATRAAVEYKTRRQEKQQQQQRHTIRRPPTNSHSTTTTRTATNTTTPSNTSSRTGVVLSSSTSRNNPTTNHRHPSPLRIQTSGIPPSSSQKNVNKSMEKQQRRREPTTPFSSIVGQFEQHLDYEGGYHHHGGDYDEDDDHDVDEDPTINSGVEWE